MIAAASPAQVAFFAVPGDIVGADLRPRPGRSRCGTMRSACRHASQRELSSTEEKMRIQMLPRVVAYLVAAIVLMACVAGQVAAAPAKHKPKAAAGGAETTAQSAIGIDTQAKHAFLLEADTDAVLLAKRAHA